MNNNQSWIELEKRRAAPNRYNDIEAIRVLEVGCYGDGHVECE